MFCDLEAAHKVEAALQIEWRGKINSRKILNGYQQRIPANIGSVHPVNRRNAGGLPFAKPCPPSAPDVQDGAYIEHRHK